MTCLIFPIFRSVDGAQLELEKMSGSIGNTWLNWEIVTPNRTEPYELVIEATVKKPGKGDIAIDDVVFDKYCVYYDGPYTTPQTTQSSSPGSTKTSPGSTQRTTSPTSASSTSARPDTSTSKSSTSTTVEQTNDTDDTSDMTTIIIVVVVGCVLLIVVIGIVFITMKRRNGGLFGYRNMPGFMTSGLSNPNYNQDGDGEVSTPLTKTIFQ